MSLKLKNVRLSGFKSIGKETHIPFCEDVTVFIGANGVGKTNFISFFQLLNQLLAQQLQTYVATKGGANTFLHFGAKITDTIEAKLDFSTEKEVTEYSFYLKYAADKLFLSYEAIVAGEPETIFDIFKHISTFPQYETGLRYYAVNAHENPDTAAKLSELRAALDGIKYFHLHDTSDTAKIKLSSLVENNAYLMHDCGNLAAFLLYLQKNKAQYYSRIVKHIQAIMPQFGDFELQQRETDRYCALNWRDKKGNFFAAHQISDGSLRFMALATLLLQPKDTLPSIIIIDEPELGLHPVALGYLKSMIYTASEHSQVVLATQSSRLLDEFDADNIVVVERDADESTTFRQLDSETLAAWLEEYDLSELYDKNILGGKP